MGFLGTNIDLQKNIDWQIWTTKVTWAETILSFFLPSGAPSYAGSMEILTL